MPNLPIFAGPPLTRALAKIGNRLLDRASNLPAHAWEPRADALDAPRDVVAELLASASLAVPVADWDSRTIDTTEHAVIIRERKPTRMSTGTVQVPGIRVVATVPFTGSSLMLTATPSQHFIGGLDCAARVRPTTTGTGYIDVMVTGRHLDSDEFERYFHKTATDIETHLSFARADLAKWELDLADRLACEAQIRVAYLDEIAALSVRLKPEQSQTS